MWNVYNVVYICKKTLKALLVKGPYLKYGKNDTFMIS